VHQSAGSDSELTDLGDDPTPKKDRSGLKRSYAIADIAVPSEPERDLGTTALDDDYRADDYHDNDPTPKKKQKAVKVPVREIVGASRKEPEFRRERSKVCDGESTTTKTSKSSFGTIKNWNSEVNDPSCLIYSHSHHDNRRSRTTGSSNAVVVSAKNKTTKSIKPEDLGDDNTACGFLEEDEAIEREAAG